MSRVRRSSSPEMQITRLQKKHATLDERLTELSSRSYLTAAEQLQAKRLKKQKLAMKDQLARIRQP